MSIRVEQKLVVYDSTMGRAIEPDTLSIDQDKLEEYFKNNPVPSDDKYTEEDLIYDLTESTGMYTLPDGTGEEMQSYIVDLLTELINGKN